LSLVLARDELRQNAAGGTNYRPVDERQVELIRHERLVGQSIVVGALESVREVPLFLSFRSSRAIDLLSSPNGVEPYGDLRARNVSPGEVQTVMPLVQALIVSALKACAVNLERLYV